MKLLNYLLLIVITMMSVCLASCDEGYVSTINIQPNEEMDEDAISQVRVALNNMPYYGSESVDSRFALPDKEELDMVFKIVIADLYGYLSSNSTTTEGRIKDCIVTSASMAMHIIQETTKEVMPDASLRYLSKYMRDDSNNLDNLIFAKGDITLEDSIGYYHNMCLYNSEIEFDISKQLNIDSIIYKINGNLPDRLSQVETNTSFIKEFFGTKIPAIYESETINDAVIIFSGEKLITDDFQEIYEPFLTGLYDNNGFHDIRNYNNYLNIIQNSNLSVSTKKTVEYAATITYASANLWDCKAILQSAHLK